MASAAGPTNFGGSADEGVCPYYHQAIELIGKRWTGAIVDALLPGPRRFSELAHAVPQISDRLLSTRLRELEAEGIVVRQVMGGTPVRVQYALSPKGRALEPAVRALRQWALDWLHPEARPLEHGAAAARSAGAPGIAL